MNAAKLFGTKRYRVIGPVDDMRVMAKELRDKSRAWYNGYYEVETGAKTTRVASVQSRIWISCLQG